jgi:allophycocyanin-B
MLSEKVKELIQKSRIVSFQSWQNYSSEAIALFQAADDRGEYLSDEDIAQLQQLQPNLAPSLQIARILRDRAPELIASARKALLAAFPEITEVGGALYPKERAEACWRDFWHFLRCITYGIAGQSTDYTSTEGLSYMEQLYRELQVPLEAMVYGLEQLRNYSLQELAQQNLGNVEPYFNHAIDRLKQFQGN